MRRVEWVSPDELVDRYPAPRCASHLCLGCGHSTAARAGELCPKCREQLDRERAEEEPDPVVAFPRRVSFPALMLNYTYRPRP